MALGIMTGSSVTAKERVRIMCRETNPIATWLFSHRRWKQLWSALLTIGLKILCHVLCHVVTHNSPSFFSPEIRNSGFPHVRTCYARHRHVIAGVRPVRARAIATGRMPLPVAAQALLPALNLPIINMPHVGLLRLVDLLPVRRLLSAPSLLFLAPLCFGFAGDSKHLSNPNHHDASSLVLLDRSRFLRSTSAVVSSCIIYPPIKSARATAAASYTQPLNSVREAVDVISASCNKRFLYNCVASGYNFLYHGLDPEEAVLPSVQTSKPCDLLNPETYVSEEAASYFAALDRRMAKEKSPVLPSNGHLATTCPKAAGEWGVAASIWPIGEENIHFAWFVDGGLFWPRPEGASEDIVVDGIDCGKISLDDVLVGDNWEVLFRADKFVAVPVKFEDELRRQLKKSFAI